MLMKNMVMLLTVALFAISTHVSGQRRGSARIGRTRTNVAGEYEARKGTPIGDMYRTNAKSVIKASIPCNTLEKAANGIRNSGRSGRGARLRELANDPKQSSATRGWLQQEINATKSGKRAHIRMPPETELAHPRGQEARHGYSHANSIPQAKELHRLQHRYDNNGKMQKQTTYTSKR